MSSSIRVLHRLRRIVLYGLAAIGLLFLLVTFTPVLSFWIHWLTGTRWDDPTEGILIVLGAESPNAGMIGHSTYWRSFSAVHTWRKGRFEKVIVTGDEAIAQSMADYMICQGIPAGSIQKETQSHTTRENAVNSSRLIAGSKARITILSSDFHMRRAYMCFRKLDIDPFCIPAPDAGKRYQSLTARWTLLAELSLETAKLIRYRLLGYV